MYKAIDVYLEKRKTRQYVGQLQKERRKFVFQYDEAYLRTGQPIPLGPDLPLNQQKHTSLKLFPSFADRIPSKQNPAYEEYCRSVGISASEANPLVLLATLGKKGPSSFICVPVVEKEAFSSEQLKQFRENLKLSIREFSDLFDVSFATVHRIENGKTSGKNALKRIEVYFKSPQTALDKIKTTGVKINERKRQFVEFFFKSQIRRNNAAVEPFTVTADDIKRCSEKQIVALIRRLSLFECHHYNIPQNSVHFSENIPAPDGGQDGLVNWSQGPFRTDYFPDQYNCFQVKKGSVTPGECKKEICNKNGNLKPAVQNVIKNKGAYILCSAHPVSGVHLKAREEAIQEEIRDKGDNPDPIKIKFYDANKIVDWLNSFPPLAVWFLKEVCLRTIRPWISWEEWSREDPDYRSEFMCHSDLEKKKHNIYNLLSKPGKAVHLAGVSGVGKTRLALESFRPDQQLDLSYLVLYGSAKGLTKYNLRELKTFRAILIIDDCSLDEAEVFHQIALREDSHLSILTIGHEKQIISKTGHEKQIISTIGNNKQTISETVKVIELSPDEEIVKKMLSGSQDITNKYIDSKWLQLTSGFPLMAKLLKDAGHLTLLKDDIPTIRKKMLWGMDQPDKKGEKVIKACSLFDTICLSDKKTGWVLSGTAANRGEEAQYIARKICKIDYDQFYKAVQFFKKKKIIQQHGRFIQVRPKPLAVWLATEFIQETPPESVMKWLTNMNVSQEEPNEHSSEGQGHQKLSDTEKRESEQGRSSQFALNELRKSFCKQFSYLNLSAEDQELGQLEDQELGKLLCGEESFFGKEQVLTTDWGAACFRYIAEANPETALKTLKRIFGNKTVNELLNIKESKNHLIWALKKIAVKKDCYLDSARLLLKFAEAEENQENKDWNNQANDQATKAFISHFQMCLSGTEAGPDIKFSIIEEIQNSESLKRKEIAVKALNKALQTGSFIRFSDVINTNSGRRFKEWQPKTYGELGDYLRAALKYLLKFTTKDSNREIRKKAREKIASNLSGLFTQNLYDDVEKAIEDVVSVHGIHWPLAVDKLLSFQKYNSKNLTEENKRQIKKILNLLKPKEDINQKLRFYVTECAGSLLYNEEINMEYKKKFPQIFKDLKNHFENADKEQLISSLEVLFHGKQRNTILFAKETAESLDNPVKFAVEFMENIKKWKKNKDFNPFFLCGFLAGLNNDNPEETKKILDHISKDDELTELIIPAYHNLSLKDQDIKRLIQVLNKTNLNTLDLKGLSIAQKCQNVSPEIMEKLIITLIKKGVESSWVALCIYSYYVYGDTDEKKKILLPALYSLLNQKNFLSDKKRYDTMDDHYYKEAVQYIMDSEYGEQFSKNFLSQIPIPDSPFYFSISDSILREVLSLILEKYPDIILSQIANGKDDYKIKSLCCHIEYDVKTISGLPIDKIKEWCERAPDKMPVFFAENMRLLVYNSWSPVAEFLFNNYGDKTDVMEAVFRNIGSFFGGGPLSSYFEQRKIAVEQLKNHKHKNVREFCEKEISYLESSIRAEKQREKEREEFGVW